MGSLTNVASGDSANSSCIQQVIDVMKGTAAAGNIPVSFTAINDTTNFALDVENLDGTNGRAFRVRDSSGTARLQVDVNGPQANPAGTGLATILTAASPVVTSGGLQLSTVVGNTIGLGATPISQTGINIGPMVFTAVAGSATVIDDLGALAAAAAGDNLTGMNVRHTFTPGAFSSVNMIGISIAANSAAQATSNKYGILVGAQTGANVANYGIFVNAQSGGSTGNWSVYAQGGESCFGLPSISSGATVGFLDIPSGANQPAGVPSQLPGGMAALRYDSSAHKLWVYDGAWKSVALT